MLAAPVCITCRRLGAPVCASCRATLEPAGHIPVPHELDACSAALDYATVRSLVTALKNGNRRDLVPLLAAHLTASFTPSPGAVVTWAPTSAARRRARGYDQAELLARAAARRWGVPVAALLRRVPGPAQAGRAASERRGNPSFTARRRCPPSVVVVDDVLTTGSTLAAAARALRAAGTDHVAGVVAAHAAGAR